MVLNQEEDGGPGGPEEGLAGRRPLGEQLPSFPSRSVPPPSHTRTSGLPAPSQHRARPGMEAGNDSSSGEATRPPQRPPGLTLSTLLPTTPVHAGAETGWQAWERTHVWSTRAPNAHSCSEGAAGGPRARSRAGFQLGRWRQEGPGARAGASDIPASRPWQPRGALPGSAACRKQGTVCQAGDQGGGLRGGGGGEWCWGPTSAGAGGGGKSVRQPSGSAYPPPYSAHRRPPGVPRTQVVNPHPGPDFSPPTSAIPPQ